MAAKGLDTGDKVLAKAPLRPTDPCASPAMPGAGNFPTRGSGTASASGRYQHRRVSFLLRLRGANVTKERPALRYASTPKNSVTMPLRPRTGRPPGTSGDCLSYDHMANSMDAIDRTKPALKRPT